MWEKNNATGHLNAKKMPLKAHENILVFYKKPPTYNPQNLIYSPRLNKRAKTGSNYGTAGNSNFSEYTNYPRSVLNFPRDTHTTHPTQKPVALFEYLVKTYTNEGDVVLDNCMGSGTTAIACLNTNRKYIGFELDKNYFDIANERIKLSKG